MVKIHNLIQIFKIFVQHEFLEQLYLYLITMTTSITCTCCLLCTGM